MSNFEVFWTDRVTFRPERTDPYLHLHFVAVFVRDQERSLRFFVDQLGFVTIVDFTFEFGQRWIEVAPPDGTAKLALIRPDPGSAEEKLIGKFTRIFFLTEDVVAKYKEWSESGVQFEYPPRQPDWGGMFTNFYDLDGNSFALAGFDEATTAMAAKRRALAERAEIERRNQQEIEIAQQVQARLLPRNPPASTRTDVAGACIQARQVGGDYYDFLDLGNGLLCFVIADIAGKGLGAALLMANLQAVLRSHSAKASQSPEVFLNTLNQVFFENSAESSYATLFLALLDEENGRLTYFNCGHLPPMLVRADGTVTQLDSTGTVVGLFRNWTCSAMTASLSAGDSLVMYTDGVTESADEAGEEYGDRRLAELVRKHRTLDSDRLVEAIVHDVRTRSAGEQQDDITVLVVKRRT